jgi:hypothetical protein
MNLDMCAIQFHVIVRGEHLHLPDLYFHLRPVDRLCDNMLDYVAEYCIDDCNGSHRRYRVRSQEVISMTCNEDEKEDQ